MSEDKVVVLARYIDVRQAEFARSILEAAGVEAFLDSPYTGSMFPHYMLGSSGVALMVHARDEDRANELLDSGGEAVLTCCVCGVTPDDTPEPTFIVASTDRGELALCNRCYLARRFDSLDAEEIDAFDAAARGNDR